MIGEPLDRLQDESEQMLYQLPLAELRPVGRGTQSNVVGKHAGERVAILLRDDAVPLPEEGGGVCHRRRCQR